MTTVISFAANVIHGEFVKPIDQLMVMGSNADGSRRAA